MPHSILASSSLSQPSRTALLLLVPSLRVPRRVRSRRGHRAAGRDENALTVLDRRVSPDPSLHTAGCTRVAQSGSGGCPCTGDGRETESARRPVGQCSLVRDGRGCNCCVIASSWLAKVVRQP